MLKNAVWNIASDTALAVKRFPLPALFCLLFCLCSILGYDKEGTYLAILFCGCFWLIGLQLFAESHAWRPLPFYALGLTIFAGMAWHLSTAPQLSIPLAFLGAGLFLGMFIAPFIGKRATGAEIWRFNYRLCLRIGFTLLAAIVLYLGLAGILTSLDFLFGLTFMDDMYGDAWLIVATFFSPLLAMAGIPTRFDTVEESYPKAMKLVLSCIAVPLLLVYAAILYSYAAKILITWELPKGGVAYLVTAFGGAGMMAYLASYPLHREPGVLRVFGRWFFPILLVPLALFAVAIGVRIHAYGVTEERYAILLCFFWLAISAVLGLVRPGGQILKGVLSTLTVLLIAASFGPWSAANLSASSQLHRLETLLEKNRVLVQGRIDPSPKDISRDDRIRISGLMDYLVETEKTDRLTPWFADLPDARIHEKKETVPQVTNMQVRLMQEMGIAYVEEYDRGGVESSSFHFVNSDMEQAVLSVSGYDYLLTLEDNRPDHAKQVTLQKSGAVLTLTFDRAAGRYVVHIEDTKEDVVFDLKTLLGRLDKKQLKTNAVAGERLFIDNASSKLAMRLIVNRAYGEIKKDGSPALSTIDALLLVKEK